MKLRCNVLYLMGIIYSTSITFAMEQQKPKKSSLSSSHIQTVQLIVQENQPFERAVPKIKALSTNNNQWEKILSCRKCTGKLIRAIAHDLQINPEPIAAFMTTPGAVQWGKKYIATRPTAYKRLQNLLIRTAQWPQHKHAWKNQDLDVAQAILEMGVSACATNEHCSAIIEAAFNNKTTFLQMLCNNGALVESKDPWDEKTALIAAASQGHNDILNFLITHNADVNAQDCFGKTALLLATNYAHVETVRILITHYAKVNICDEEGVTPLTKARQTTFSDYKERYQTIEKMLVAAGAIE